MHIVAKCFRLRIGHEVARTAMPCCWCFRPWTRRARAARDSVEGVLQFGKHGGRADEHKHQAHDSGSRALGGFVHAGQKPLHRARALLLPSGSAVVPESRLGPRPNRTRAQTPEPRSAAAATARTWCSRPMPPPCSARNRRATRSPPARQGPTTRLPGWWASPKASAAGGFGPEQRQTGRLLAVDVQPPQRAVQQTRQLLRSAVHRLLHRGRLVGHGHRLPVFKTRLQHAALVSLTALAGVFVTRVNLHLGDVVAWQQREEVTTQSHNRWLMQTWNVLYASCQAWHHV